METNSFRPLEGIYVSAFFCQQALQEKNGMLSAIRIGHKYDITLPDDIPVPFPIIETNAVLIFRSDEARTFTASLAMTDPTGKDLGIKDWKCKVSEDAGHIIIAEMKLSSSVAGTFRCSVLIDGNVVMKMPLIVTHNSPDLILTTNPEPTQPGETS